MFTRRLALGVFAVVVAVAGFVALSSPQTAAQDKGPNRVKWEYKVLKGEPDEKKLNELGDDGWELWQVTGGEPYIASFTAPNPAFGTTNTMKQTTQVHYFRRPK